MIASDSFVLRGNVNLVFPSLLMQFWKFFLCLLNLPHAYDMQAGNLVEDKGFLLGCLYGEGPALLVGLDFTSRLHGEN